MQRTAHQVVQSLRAYLMVRKQERGSGVLATLGIAASASSQLQQYWDGMQYLGGAAGFQHQLCWEHE